MNLTKSSNPVLREQVFTRERTYNEEVMTVNGTIGKTAVMLLLVVAAAMFTWNKFYHATDPAVASTAIMPWMLAGGIGGFILAIITSFSPKSSPITVPIYSILQGLFLGGISAIYAVRTGGIVIQAVMLTLAVFAVMLFLYRSGIIKVTRKFMLGVVAATGGIALLYLISFIAGFFGANMSFLYGNSNLSIGISLVVVAVAALNLVLDFSFIENTALQGAPKYMEWYGAFGLMVTLIWLYLEILRLLAKISSRD